MEIKTQSQEPLKVKTDAEGAVYRPLHVERRVKIYPIQEHELESLSDANSNSTLWASIAAAAFGLLAGCIWDMATSDKTPPRQSIVIAIGIAAAGVASVILSYRYRQSIAGRLEKIRSESTVS